MTSIFKIEFWRQALAGRNLLKNAKHENKIKSFHFRSPAVPVALGNLNIVLGTRAAGTCTTRALCPPSQTRPTAPLKTMTASRSSKPPRARGTRLPQWPRRAPWSSALARSSPSLSSAWWRGSRPRGTRSGIARRTLRRRKVGSKIVSLFYHSIVNWQDDFVKLKALKSLLIHLAQPSTN